MDIKRSQPATTVARTLTVLAALLLVPAAACERARAVSTERLPVTLRIGLGLTADTTRPDIGIRSIARQIALEGLVGVQRDGKLAPRLAEEWSSSNAGLTWRVRLRKSATFHSGSPANADTVKRVLEVRLRDALGPTFDDIEGIHAESDRDLVFTLRRPSAFLMERLADVAIEEPGAPLSGTGPFAVRKIGRQIEMAAYRSYHGGNPAIDQIVIEPYSSVRAAWADMLRGNVDMLYEVGVDAVEFMESSSEVKIFKFQRGYEYLVLLNVQKPYLRDAGFRRDLNAAIDRDAILADVFRGHGAAANGAVWPRHWAHSAALPQIHYEPRPIATSFTRRSLKCLFGDPSLERLALTIQKQLQAVGVELELELVPGEQMLARLQSGDFDVVLSDYLQGPSLVRPYWFWHSGAPFNYGKYANADVDTALDSIRHARDDVAYTAGVAAFERAIVSDPPAIFIAWGERARALSNRFEMPLESDTGVLGKLHLWRPAVGANMVRRN